MDLSTREAGLRPVEYALAGYLVITSMVALLRLQAQPACRWVLLANALYAVLLGLFVRARLGRVGLALREIHPLLVLTALYGAIDILNEFGSVPTHDRRIMMSDQAIFGGQISREWWLRYPSRFWSTVLHGSYFAYYPIVLLPVLYFLASGRRVACRRSVLWLMATFLSCYLVFLFFPVAGPYYEFPRPSALMLDNPMARLVYATLARGSSYGAAFPSSHVAAALVATAAAFFGSRTVGWLLIGPAILLSVGVVYCQMHYAADALSGVGLAALVVVGGALGERKAKGLRTEGKTALPSVLSPQSSVLSTEP